MQSLNQVIEDKRYNVNNNKTNNVNNVKRAYGYNIADVRKRATLIADKLNDQKSINFYYKVCWQLPENIIWNNLEQAQGGKNPRAYFTFLCKLSMEKN